MEKSNRKLGEVSRKSSDNDLPQLAIKKTHHETFSRTAIEITQNQVPAGVIYYPSLEHTSTTTKTASNIFKREKNLIETFFEKNASLKIRWIEISTW